MSSVQLLIEQKAALENEIARAIKAAEEKKKSLDDQIAKQRAQEISQGRAEIRALLAKYNLSPEEALGAEPAVTPAADNKRGSYLSEIRQYYNGQLGQEPVVKPHVRAGVSLMPTSPRRA